MIKGYNNSRLEGLGIDSKYFLICQLWKELTDKRTFDSYQFKSINVINGISELLHNINAYLDTTVPTTHLIISSSEELMRTISSDYVMKISFPSVTNRLLSVLGKKADTDAKIKSVKYQLNLYQNKLVQCYDSAMISCLLQAIDENNAHNIISLTSTFMSRCVDWGWSTDALVSKLENGLREGKTLEDILTAISNCPNQNYAILFPYRLNITPPSGKTRAEAESYVCAQLHQFNIDIYSSDEIIQKYSGIDSSKVKPTAKYMLVTCSEKDIYSASHAGILKLSGVLNVLSFFSAINPWSINDNSWIAYNIDSPYTQKLSPSNIYKTYEYLDSSTAVYSRLSELLNSQAINSDLFQKLMSSFSYANLSRISMSIEEKYMNMWIGLEALVKTDTYANIIGNILECVSNASVLRYFYKQVRNFIEDCGRCSVSLDFGDLKIDIGNHNKEELVASMLKIMRDDSLCAELETRCQCCKLLYVRCQDIASIARSDNALIQHIQRHHQTVQWHLNRLYRIRNEIAHSALQQNVSTVKYIEHLYDYLSTYISEVIRFAVTKETISFGVLSAAINDNYNEFEYIAGEKNLKPKQNFLGSLWTSGVIDFV